MQSETQESILKKNFQFIVVLLIAVVISSLVFFRNFLFQSTYLLKSFGEASVDPAIAFKNNKPIFLEFYAEWCEVCKEMAPKVSSIKKEFENDINFVFLNVDNQKWDNYIRRFEVNGIPQVNLFDKKGNLLFTFIGKQEEITIRESLDKLKKEAKANEEILKGEFSVIRDNNNEEVSPRSHG